MALIQIFATGKGAFHLYTKSFPDWWVLYVRCCQNMIRHQTLLVGKMTSIQMWGTPVHVGIHTN